MDTWRRGRRVHHGKSAHRIHAARPVPGARRQDADARRGHGVFLSSRTDVVPGALLHNLKHNKVLHERVVIATCRGRGHAAGAAATSASRWRSWARASTPCASITASSRPPTCPQALRRRAPLRPGARCRHRDLLHRPRDAGAGRTFRARPLAHLALLHHGRQRAVARALLSSAAQPGGRTRHPDHDLRRSAHERTRRPPRRKAPLAPAQRGADAGRAGRGVRRHRHQPALRHARDRAGRRRRACPARPPSMARCR